MDRHDPNQWTVQFAAENRNFCIREIREFNYQVINCLEQGEKMAAIVGLDRILNGLVTLINAGCDCRSEVCFFSWVQANIMLFGNIDAPRENIIQTARKALLDARDFAKSERAKIDIQGFIDELNRGYPVSKLKDRYGTDFPKSEIQLLQDLHEKLGRHCVSEAAAPASASPAGGKKKHTGVLVAVLLLVLAALVVFGMKIFFAPKEYQPAPITGELQADGKELVGGDTVPEDTEDTEQMTTESSASHNTEATEDANADIAERIVGSWRYKEIKDGATTPDGEPLPDTLLVLEYWFYDNGRCGMGDSFYEEADENGQQYAEFIDGRYWVCVGGGGQEGSYCVTGNVLTITTDQSVQYTSETLNMTFTLEGDLLTVEDAHGVKTYTRTE